MAWRLFPGDVAYVWHGGLLVLGAAAALVSAGFNLRAQIIWSKQMAPISRGDYRCQHEPCWYAVRKGRRGHFVGDRSQTTIWQIHNFNTVGGMTTDEGDQYEIVDCRIDGFDPVASGNGGRGERRLEHSG